MREFVLPFAAARRIVTEQSLSKSRNSVHRDRAGEIACATLQLTVAPKTASAAAFPLPGGV
jgi:hypothetical protein